MSVFRNRIKTPSRIPMYCVGVLILLSMLSGCGSVKHKLDLHDNYSPEPGTTIEVGKVTNETGQSFNVNIEQMLTDAIAEELRKENLLWTGQGTTKLVLSSKLIEYEKGNAFKRWLLPGWGSTVLTVQAELRKDDQLVGYEQARRTVSIGGGYTIGAWKTIFRSVAVDIVEDLREKIPK